MKNIKILLLVVLSLHFFKWGALAQSKDLFLPENGKKWLLIGQDNKSVAEYMRAIKMVPDGFMVYTSIQEMQGLIEESDYGAGPQNFQELVGRYPKVSFLQVGLYMVGALEDVVQGKLDGNIDRLSDWIKKSDKKIFLRIGYEFDLPENHYEPALYVKAWRHIVERMDRNQVKNVVYVWHSYAASSRKIEPWYPGDDVVDWCALSYFYAGAKNAQILEFAKIHQKPLMIAEATPRGMNSSKNPDIWSAWYQDFFDFIEDKNVQAICYINANWDDQPMWKNQNWGDSRIQTNPKLKKKWLSKIKIYR